MVPPDPALFRPAQDRLLVSVIHMPTGLLAGYDGDVVRGIYPTRESALLHGLIESNRHHGGRYSTLRVDLRDPDDKRPDTPRDEGSADDAIAAADALMDSETSEPEAGDASDEDGPR